MMQSLSKTCKRCETDKPMANFYKHKDMNDGRLSYCKDCTKKRVYKHRSENIERIRFYDRNRPNSIERKHIEMEQVKKDPIRYKKLQEARAEWAKRNKQKRECHRAVYRAVKNNQLIRPEVCVNCDKRAKRIEAHHCDYSKPLEVRWLCYRCHRNEHKRDKKEKND